MGGRPRIVIVGAGFGGLAVARSLAAAPVELTLVDRHNYHLFQPLLYQVATAGLDAEDIAQSVRGILAGRPNVTFRLATVVAADLDQRLLRCADGSALAYDHLVLAPGSVSDDFGIDGVADHGFPLKGLPDALAIRSHVLAQFERASADPSAIEAGALTFVVAGGGPTGVEMAGALVELIGHVLAGDYPRIDTSRARVVLVEASDRLLPPYSNASQRHATETLRRRGVEVRLSAPVARVEAGAVVLHSGEHIATRTLVWAAGVRAHPLGAALGLTTERGGRVPVAADLTVPGHDDVWVVGDLAGAVGDRPAYPQVAPVALQQARLVGTNIRRRLDGRPTRPFRYRDRGSMATIGRRAAVAELPLGLRFRGTVAWLLWLGLHLVTLVGFRNRLNVFVNWVWNYLTYDRGSRLILPEPAQPSDPPA